VAADLVVDKIDAHSPAGFPLEEITEAVAEIVVVNDEKLHKDVALRRLDRLENGPEGLVAVDEQDVSCEALGAKARE
jgi:hypothetical protein